MSIGDAYTNMAPDPASVSSFYSEECGVLPGNAYTNIAPYLTSVCSFYSE